MAHLTAYLTVKIEAFVTVVVRPPGLGTQLAWVDLRELGALNIHPPVPGNDPEPRAFASLGVVTHLTAG